MTSQNDSINFTYNELSKTAPCFVVIDLYSRQRYLNELLSTTYEHPAIMLFSWLPDNEKSILDQRLQEISKLPFQDIIQTPFMVLIQDLSQYVSYWDENLFYQGYLKLENNFAKEIEKSIIKKRKSKPDSVSEEVWFEELMHLWKKEWFDEN